MLFGKNWQPTLYFWEKQNMRIYLPLARNGMNPPCGSQTVHTSDVGSLSFE